MIHPSIHCFDTVVSTNDIAINMAKCGASEGTIVVAKQQTKGRGRRGKVWLDEPGQCLLMSVVLRPDKRADELSQLTFVASLSVAEVLHQLGLQASLKWPNDVYVQGRKIAGILLEVAFCDTRPAVVIGIGMNINQTSFPDNIADTATSIAIETKKQIDPDYVANLLIDILFANYEKCLTNGFDDILIRWQMHMWGVGSNAEVISQGNNIKGTIIGIDARGALMLKNRRGYVHEILAADAVNLRVNK